jgi:hypothetical protein
VERGDSVFARGARNVGLGLGKMNYTAAITFTQFSLFV